MELADLIKALPLVPQFQTMLSNLRQHSLRLKQVEYDSQAAESKIGELRSDIERLERQVHDLERLERQVQELKSNVRRT